MCNALLPDDIAREYAGTPVDTEAAGSTGTAEGDRKRRADSKKKAAEASVRVGTSAKKVKAEDSGSGMTDHFKEVMATVVEAFKPEPVQSNAGGSSAQTADSACVNVTVLDAHMDSHGRCLENIEKEESKGGNANTTRLMFLKQQRDGLEKKIKELIENGL